MTNQLPPPDSTEPYAVKELAPPDHRDYRAPMRRTHPFVAWVERFPNWPAWQLIPLAIVAFVAMCIAWPHLF